MEKDKHSFRQSDDELQGPSKVSKDRKWLMAVSKLTEQDRSKSESKMNSHCVKQGTVLETRPSDNIRIQEDKYPNKNHYNNNNINTKNFGGYPTGSKYSGNSQNCKNKNLHYNSTNKNDDGTKVYEVVDQKNDDSTKVYKVADKRFIILPAMERIPRHEVLGGYIFVCNKDTMQDSLNLQLFGLPRRYKDSVRIIIPGLPLFLFNYNTNQLHGIFEATSFGGFNMEPTAWEDENCKGESGFPAQVRIRIRKLCEPLHQNDFRPVLHHYTSSKFRLEFTVPETLKLLDLFEEAGSSA